MANSVIPILLAITCTAMVISIFKARKTNKSLMEKTEKTETELKLALAYATDKTGALTPKDKEVVSLTDRLNSMDGEKTKIEEELNKIKSKLEQANTAKKTLHDEMDKLAAELVALKDPSENTTEEIAMNQPVTAQFK